MYQFPVQKTLGRKRPDCWILTIIYSNKSDRAESNSSCLGKYLEQLYPILGGSVWRRECKNNLGLPSFFERGGFFWGKKWSKEILCGSRVSGIVKVGVWSKEASALYCLVKFLNTLCKLTSYPYGVCLAA